ncbi:hypothetical protein [Desulforhopalus singaporensis]|uniref:Uncharacterized protein n=1 Tax=Desulforhopalus singaporensis TaxID=91360 RepID=A0A1H0URQ6_9BACT|nr:hypothetical protein [Desulforhopalus singaporensis]SDP68800.1 hypothetical protein SAMN05660330_03689 [Desulforhopalus singaporensis]
MKNSITDIYKGWTISVAAKDEQCSQFTFTISSPSGQSQYVPMGGITKQRAIERAREMIDMEISFAGED